MADRLSLDDLAAVDGCKHDDGPVIAAVGLALQDFFTPARRNALVTALQNRVPGIEWTPRRALRALRTWVEREPE
jgi:hypothetical protein